MNVLVCGSRDFEDAQLIWDVLRGIQNHEHFTIISGMANGADSHAVAWAKANHRDLLPFPADWRTFGKAAGSIRNTKMLVNGKPDLVLAFVNKPLAESRGTANMVQQAKRARVKTIVIQS